MDPNDRYVRRPRLRQRCTTVAQQESHQAAIDREQIWPSSLLHHRQVHPHHLVAKLDLDSPLAIGTFRASNELLYCVSAPHRIYPTVDAGWEIAKGRVHFD